MTLTDLARTEVVTTSPDETVAELARTLRDENIGCVVVTDDEEQPLGIVTDRDLAT